MKRFLIALVLCTANLLSGASFASPRFNLKQVSTQGDPVKGQRSKPNDLKRELGSEFLKYYSVKFSSSVSSPSGDFVFEAITRNGSMRHIFLVSPGAEPMEIMAFSREDSTFSLGEMSFGSDGAIYLTSASNGLAQILRAELNGSCSVPVPKIKPMVQVDYPLPADGITADHPNRYDHFPAEAYKEVSGGVAELRKGSIAAFGCNLTSYAMVLNTMGYRKNENGSPDLDPPFLNQIFQQRSLQPGKNSVYALSASLRPESPYIPNYPWINIGMTPLTTDETVVSGDIVSWRVPKIVEETTIPAADPTRPDMKLTNEKLALASINSNLFDSYDDIKQSITSELCQGRPAIANLSGHYVVVSEFHDVDDFFTYDPGSRNNNRRLLKDRNPRGTLSFQFAPRSQFNPEFFVDKLHLRAGGNVAVELIDANGRRLGETDFVSGVVNDFGDQIGIYLRDSVGIVNRIEDENGIEKISDPIGIGTSLDIVSPLVGLYRLRVKAQSDTVSRIDVTAPRLGTSSRPRSFGVTLELLAGETKEIQFSIEDVDLVEAPASLSAETISLGGAANSSSFDITLQGDQDTFASFNPAQDFVTVTLGEGFEYADAFFSSGIKISNKNGIKSVRKKLSGNRYVIVTSDNRIRVVATGVSLSNIEFSRPTYLNVTLGNRVYRAQISSGKNFKPYAYFGEDRRQIFGEEVALLGSLSRDLGTLGVNPISYNWELVSKPANSNIEAPINQADWKFTPDKRGQYKVRLVANDGTYSSDPVEKTIIINTPPQANLVPQDSAPREKKNFIISGDGSSDVDGDTLSFDFRLLQKPEGSAAFLQTAFGASRRGIFPDLPGTYVIELVVNDGLESSAPVTLSVNVAPNQLPVANAGADARVVAGFMATLDGSASYDPEGDPLTYRWELVSQPEGSSLPTQICFLPTCNVVSTIPGQYVLKLVVNDGFSDSLPDEAVVILDPPNRAPVAVASAPDQVRLGEPVSLSGASSYDPDNQALTYQWYLEVRPFGSVAQISGAQSSTASFTPDKIGQYWARLDVSDGELSASTYVPIQVVENYIPIARILGGGNFPQGSQVTLDGSTSSDSDGDPLTLNWRMITKPSGSTAQLSGTGGLSVSLTLDKIGLYQVELKAFDGRFWSKPKVVSLQGITTTPEAPQLAAISNQIVSVGQALVLQLQGTDNNGDALSYSLVSPNPALPGMGVQTPQGLFFFRPNETQIGNHSITVAVSDGQTSTQKSFSVSVVGGQTYGFSKVADSQMGFSDFPGKGAPAINSDGWVAFSGLDSSGSGIFLGSGAGPVLGVTNQSSIFDAVSNDGYVAWNTADQSKILMGRGGSPQTVLDRAGTTYDYFNRPVINNLNDVAFQAGRYGNMFGIFVNVENSFVISEPAGTALSPPSMDDSYGVAWSKNGQVSLVSRGDEGARSLVGIAATTAVSPTSTLSQLGSSVDLNNLGRISFWARRNDGSQVVLAFTGNAANNRTIMSTGVTFSGLGGQPSINDSSEVAFSGLLAGTGEKGIFLGSGASSGAGLSYQKIVKVGDKIDLQYPEATVIDLALFKNGLNNAGQVAFYAELSNGIKGIYRADPKPLNQAPEANAGVDQTVQLGSQVQLDGSGSSDAEGQSLTYHWTLVAPAGSQASLSDPNVVRPLFNPDVSGNYIAELVVNDGMVSSEPDTVLITVQAPNDPPIANAGPDQNILVGATVSLDGRDSFDPEGRAISYSWALVEKPAGSSASIAQANTAQTSFIPDVAGEYLVSLTVNDGTFSSTADFAKIIAAPQPPSIFEGQLGVVKSRIKFKGKKKDKFYLDAAIRPSQDSDGLLPISENLTLKIGNEFEEVIPAGSFTQLSNGKYRYVKRGKKNGISHIKIGADGRLQIWVRKASIDGISLNGPVAISVQIGNDRFSIQLPYDNKGRFPGRPGIGNSRTEIWRAISSGISVQDKINDKPSVREILKSKLKGVLQWFRK